MCISREGAFTIVKHRASPLPKAASRLGICGHVHYTCTPARPSLGAECKVAILVAILCTGGLDVIRKDAWHFYRKISGVRLCRELEEPKGPKGRSVIHFLFAGLPREGI